MSVNWLYKKIETFSIFHEKVSRRLGPVEEIFTKKLDFGILEFKSYFPFFRNEPNKFEFPKFSSLHFKHNFSLYNLNFYFQVTLSSHLALSSLYPHWCTIQVRLSSILANIIFHHKVNMLSPYRNVEEKKMKLEPSPLKETQTSPVQHYSILNH